MSSAVAGQSEWVIGATLRESAGQLCGTGSNLAPSMDAASVGRRVKTAYEAAGLSQRQLSDLTEISQSTLSRIVSGERTAKTGELFDIARATGISVSDLIESVAASRMFYAPRASDATYMTVMCDRLLQFAGLNPQGI